MLPSPQGWAVAEAAVGLVLIAASIVAYRRRLAPPLWVSLLVGLLVRATVVGLAEGHTPNDVGIVFHTVAQMTWAHQDALRLPRHFWNFIPAMAYVLAGEWKTGLPWQLAVKIAPVTADLVTIGLVGLLVRDDPARARTTRLLYALSPIAVLVGSHHGQVEPVAAALGVAALVLAQRGHSVGSGGLLGLAIAVKTWPVVFVPGVLRELPRRQWYAAAAPAAFVVLFLLSTVRWVLHDSVRHAVHVVASYRSYLGTYGWSGLLHLYGNAGAGYNGAHVDGYQRVGTVLTALVVATLIVLFRHLDGVTLTAVVVLGVLAVAAGFGGQYLLWPVAVLLAAGPRRMGSYLLAASVFLVFWYFVALPAPAPHPATALRGVDYAQVWLSLVVIAGALAAIPWEKRNGGLVTLTRHQPAIDSEI